MSEQLPDGAAVLKHAYSGEWVGIPRFIYGSEQVLGPFQTKAEAIKAVREARGLPTEEPTP